MVRKIIKINEDLCNGCGLCADACHEHAIEIVDGKAKLIRDDYCDGLGNCLPSCPTGAITFEQREAAAYDEEAVAARQAEMAKKRVHPSGAHAHGAKPHACGCPGSMAKALERTGNTQATAAAQGDIQSELKQWPLQIKLVPTNAPYFNNADLLIAADCTAFSFGDFHRKFMKNKITLIGCPKLDEGDYAEKLTEILTLNTVKSVTVVRMEVPCCSGIVQSVKTALQNSGSYIPWRVIVIGRDGSIVEES